MRRLRLVLVLALAAALLPLATRPAAADEAPPLVIVFDTSGSMGDRTSDGSVKMQTAQKLMTELTASQTEKTRLGLWTYPGGATVDGCAAGAWVPSMSPLDNPDPTDVDATIRLLSPGGGTPTGPALRAVVDSMKQQGFASGTLVLVSDGESNCGTPPCEVAGQIGAEGFDLTVAAVAFDVRDGGTDELECIANVTGGSYSEADDAAELIEILSQYQAADLELEVDAPGRVLQGATAQLTATITNPSTQTVRDLTALIAFDQNSRDVISFIQAPRRPLAVLEPGQSAEVIWNVVTSSGSVGQTNWRILVGSEASGAVSTAGVLEITDADLTRDDAGPLLQEGGGVAVVFGDSYSSGEGVRPYDDQAGKCHRSRGAYGAVVGGDFTQIIACSGAVSPHLGSVSQHGFAPQLQQLAELGVTPDIAFLTIGGNDIGFGSILTDCFINLNCATDKKRNAFFGQIEGRRASFTNSYVALAKALNSPELLAMRSGKIAPVVVSPYPDMFWDPTRGTCSIDFSPREIRMARELQVALNREIRIAVEKAQELQWPVYFADTVADFALNHSMCVSDSYFVRVHLGSAVSTHTTDAFSWEDTDRRQELAHPNARGHRAWANALIQWSQSTRASRPPVLPQEFTEAQGTADRLLEQLKELLLSPALTQEREVRFSAEALAEDGTLVRTEAVVPVRAGDSVTITMDGMLPGTLVTVTVRSAPQALAALTVDDDGQVEATVDLPLLDSGPHELSAFGTSEAGETVGQAVVLQVRSEIPVALVAVAAFGLLGLLTAITFRLLAWRSRRAASPRVK